MRETKDVQAGEGLGLLAEMDEVRDAALAKQTLEEVNGGWSEIEDFSQSHQSQTPSHNRAAQIS